MASNGIASYLKNLGESVVYAGTESIKEVMPVTHSFLVTAKDTAKETYKSIVESKAINIKLSSMTDNQIFKQINKGFQNLKADLKSGKFYNEDREDMGSMMEMLMNMDGGELFQVDLEAIYGKQNNSENENDPQMMVTKGDALVAGSIASTTYKSTNAIAQTLVRLHDTDYRFQKTAYNASLMQSQKQIGLSRAGFEAMTQGFNALIDFNNQIMRTHVENSTKFYDEMTKIQKDAGLSLQKLAEIQTQMKKALDPKEAIKEASKGTNIMDFFDKGILKPKAYLNLVKLRLNQSPLGSYYQMISMLPMMLSQAVQNPMHSVMKWALQGLISGTAETVIKQLDKTISGAFTTGLAKLADYGSLNSDTMLGQLAQILGLKQQRPSFAAIDASKFNRGPMPWNGLAQKSIVEVIPGYLKRIEAALTGQGERTWDSATGKWVTGEDADYEKSVDTKLAKEAAKPLLDKMFSAVDMMGFKLQDAKDFKDAIVQAITGAFKQGYINLEDMQANPTKYVEDKYANILPTIQAMLSSIGESSADLLSVTSEFAKANAKKQQHIKDLETGLDTDTLLREQVNNSSQGRLKAVNGLSAASKGVWTNNILQLTDKHNMTLYDYQYAILQQLRSMGGLGGSGGATGSGTPPTQPPGLPYDPNALLPSSALNLFIKGIDPSKTREQLIKDYADSLSRRDLDSEIEKLVKRLETETAKKPEQQNQTEIDDLKLLLQHMSSISAFKQKEEEDEQDIDFDDQKAKIKSLFGEYASNYMDALRNGGDEDLTLADLDRPDSGTAKKVAEAGKNVIDVIQKSYKNRLDSKGGWLQKLWSAPSDLLLQGAAIADAAIYNIFFGTNTGKRDADGKPIQGMAQLLNSKLTETFDTVNKTLSEWKQSFLDWIGGDHGISSWIKAGLSSMGIDLDKTVTTLKLGGTKVAKSIGKGLAGSAKSLFVDAYNATQETFQDTKRGLSALLPEKESEEGTNAQGARNIQSSGLTWISKGEAIIPASLNQFNPERNSVNIFQQQAQEEKMNEDYKAGKGAKIAVRGAGFPTHALGKNPDEEISAQSILQELQENGVTTKEVSDIVNAKNPTDADKLIKEVIAKHKGNPKVKAAVKKLKIAIWTPGRRSERSKQLGAAGKVLALSGVQEKDNKMVLGDEYKHNNELMNRFFSQEVLGNANNSFLEQLRYAAQQLGITMDTNEQIDQKTLAEQNNPVAGIRQFMNAAFGLDPVRGASQVSDYLIKNNKTVTKGALGGAVLSTVLPLGGPLMGALLGIGASMLNDSDSFKEYMFGKMITDSDGNEKRAGGLISRKVMDVYQKYAPKAKVYGTAGLLAGMLTPFGPLGGAMVGVGASIIRNNTQLNNFLFGDEGGLLNKDRKAKLKKALPHIGMATIGSLFFGPFGVLGNAALGAGIGLVSTSESFKRLMLGTKDKDGIRRGGIAEAIRTQITIPLKETMREIKDNMGTWFRDKILTPVGNGLKPMAKVGLSVMKQGMKSLFDRIGRGIGTTWLGRKAFQALGAVRNIGSLGKGLLKKVGGLAEWGAQKVQDAGEAVERWGLEHGKTDLYSAAERNELRAKYSQTMPSQFNVLSAADKRMVDMQDGELEKTANLARMYSAAVDGTVDREFKNRRNATLNEYESTTLKLEEQFEDSYTKRLINSLSYKIRKVLDSNLAPEKMKEQTNEILADIDKEKDPKIKAALDKANVKGLLEQYRDDFLEKIQKIQSDEDDYKTGEFLTKTRNTLRERLGSEGVSDEDFDKDATILARNLTNEVGFRKRDAEIAAEKAAEEAEKNKTTNAVSEAAKQNGEQAKTAETKTEQPNPSDLTTASAATRATIEETSGKVETAITEAAKKAEEAAKQANDTREEILKTLSFMAGTYTGGKLGEDPTTITTLNQDEIEFNQRLMRRFDERKAAIADDPQIKYQKRDLVQSGIDKLREQIDTHVGGQFHDTALSAYDKSAAFMKTPMDLMVSPIAALASAVKDLTIFLGDSFSGERKSGTQFFRNLEAKGFTTGSEAMQAAAKRAAEEHEAVAKDLNLYEKEDARKEDANRFDWMYLIRHSNADSIKNLIEGMSEEDQEKLMATVPAAERDLVREKYGLTRQSPPTNAFGSLLAGIGKGIKTAGSVIGKSVAKETGLSRFFGSSDKEDKPKEEKAEVVEVVPAPAAPAEAASNAMAAAMNMTKGGSNVETPGQKPGEFTVSTGEGDLLTYGRSQIDGQPMLLPNKNNQEVLAKQKHKMSLQERSTKAIEAMADKFGAGTKQVGKKATGGLFDMLKDLINLPKNLLNSILPGLGTGIYAVGSMLGAKLLGALKSFIEPGLASVKEWMSKSMTSVKSFIGKGFSSAKDWLLKKFSSVFSGVKSYLPKFLSKLGTKGKLLALAGTAAAGWMAKNQFSSDEEEIPTNASGIGKAEKSGWTWISKGEAIVPAEENVFNPERKKAGRSKGETEERRELQRKIKAGKGKHRIPMHATGLEDYDDTEELVNGYGHQRTHSPGMIGTAANMLASLKAGQVGSKMMDDTGYFGKRVIGGKQLSKLTGARHAGAGIASALASAGVDWITTGEAPELSDVAMDSVRNSALYYGYDKLLSPNAHRVNVGTEANYLLNTKDKLRGAYTWVKDGAKAVLKNSGWKGKAALAALGLYGGYKGLSNILGSGSSPGDSPAARKLSDVYNEERPVAPQKSDFEKLSPLTQNILKANPVERQRIMASLPASYKSYVQQEIQGITKFTGKPSGKPLQVIPDQLPSGEPKEGSLTANLVGSLAGRMLGGKFGTVGKLIGGTLGGTLGTYASGGDVGMGDIASDLAINTGIEGVSHLFGKKAVKEVKQLPPGASTNAVKNATKALDTVKDTTKELGSKALDTLKEKTGSIGSSALDTIKNQSKSISTRLLEKSQGLTSKILDIYNAAKTRLDTFYSGISKIIGEGPKNAVKKFFELILNKLKDAKYIGPKIAKLTARQTAGITAGSATLGFGYAAVMVGFAIKDFYDGYTKTAEILGIPEDKATLGMKMLCGIINGLINFVPVIGPLLPAEEITKMAITFLGPIFGCDIKALQQQKKEAKETTHAEQTEAFTNRAGTTQPYRATNAISSAATPEGKKAIEPASSPGILHTRIKLAGDLSKEDIKARKTEILMKVQNAIDDIITKLSDLLDDDTKSSLKGFVQEVTKELDRNQTLEKTDRLGEGLRSIVSGFSNILSSADVVAAFSKGKQMTKDILGVPNTPGMPEGIRTLAGLSYCISSGLPFLTQYIPLETIKNLLITYVGPALGISAQDLSQMRHAVATYDGSKSRRFYDSVSAIDAASSVFNLASDMVRGTETFKWARKTQTGKVLTSMSNAVNNSVNKADVQLITNKLLDAMQEVAAAIKKYIPAAAYDALKGFGYTLVDELTKSGTFDNATMKLLDKMNAVGTDAFAETIGKIDEEKARTQFVSGTHNTAKIFKFKENTTDPRVKILAGIITAIYGSIPFIDYLIREAKLTDLVIRNIGGALGITKNVLETLKKLSQQNLHADKQAAIRENKKYENENSLSGRLKTAATGAISEVANVGSKIANSVAETASSMWESVKTGASNAISAVANSDTVKAIKSGVTAVGDAIGSGIDWVANKAGDVRDSLFGKGKKGQGLENTAFGQAMGPGQTFYSQLDPRYNRPFNVSGDTIYQDAEDSACAAFAGNNALSKLGIQSDPNESIDFALHNGYKEINGGVYPGFYKGYFNKHGVQSESLFSKDKVVEYASHGNPVVVMGKDVNGESDKHFFGENPHYGVITGMADSEHAIVQDSESKTPNKVYPLHDILSKSSVAIGAKRKPATSTRKRSNKPVKPVILPSSIGTPATSSEIIRQEQKSQSGIARAAMRPSTTGRSIKPKRVTPRRYSRYGKGGGDEANKAKIWQYFIEKKFSNQAAAGAIGNMMQESSLVPHVRENCAGGSPFFNTTAEDAMQNGGGYGLVQWTAFTTYDGEYSEASPDRLQGLINLAKSQGKPTSDLYVQLDFIMQEMASRPKLINALNKAKSSDEAADAWLDYYEYSDGAPRETVVAATARRSNAREVLQQFAKGQCNQSIIDIAAQTTGGSAIPLGGSSTSSSSMPGKTTNRGLFGVISDIAEIFANALNPFSSSSTQTTAGNQYSFNASNFASTSTDLGIRKASQWAQNRVGTEGYGGNGCTAFARDFLLQAGNPLGEKMSSNAEGLMWVPNLYDWAAQNNALKPAQMGGKEGDVAIIETNDNPADGPDHVVIADGQGGFWGNSSSRNQIVHEPLSMWGANNIKGYVNTGVGVGKVVASGASGYTAEQRKYEAESRTGRGKHKYGRSLVDSRQGEAVLNSAIQEMQQQQQPQQPQVELPQTVTNNIPQQSQPAAPSNVIATPQTAMPTTSSGGRLERLKAMANSIAQPIGAAMRNFGSAFMNALSKSPMASFIKDIFGDLNPFSGILGIGSSNLASSSTGSHTSYGGSYYPGKIAEGTGESAAEIILSMMKGCEITGEFGEIRNGGTKHHAGIDISDGTNSPVFTPTAGTIYQVNSTAEDGGGYGRYVWLKDAANVYHLFAHLDSIESGITVGADVPKGACIGLQGGSGDDGDDTYAIHLHYQVDPDSWVSQYKTPIGNDSVEHINPHNYRPPDASDGQATLRDIKEVPAEAGQGRRYKWGTGKYANPVMEDLDELQGLKKIPQAKNQKYRELPNLGLDDKLYKETSAVWGKGTVPRRKNTFQKMAEATNNFLDKVLGRKSKPTIQDNPLILHQNDPIELRHEKAQQLKTDVQNTSVRAQQMQHTNNGQNIQVVDENTPETSSNSGALGGTVSANERLVPLKQPAPVSTDLAGNKVDVLIKAQEQTNQLLSNIFQLIQNAVQQIVGKGETAKAQPVASKPIPQQRPMNFSTLMGGGGSSPLSQTMIDIHNVMKTHALGTGIRL